MKMSMNKNRESDLQLGRLIFKLFDYFVVNEIKIQAKHSFQQKCFTFLIVILNVFFTFCNVNIIISFSIVNRASSIGRANTVFTAATILHKWVLLWQYDRLKNISQKLSDMSEKLNINFDGRLKTWIWIWIVLTLVLHLIISLCSFFAVWSFDARYFLYGYSVQNENGKTVLCLLYFFLLFYTMMPLSIFSAYYTVVCCHIKNLLEHILKSLSLEQTLEVNFLTTYSSIKSLISDADTNLALLMSISCLFSASCLHFGVTMIMNYDEFPGLDSQLSVWCLLANGYLTFVVMTAAATLIFEASEKVYEKAHSLLHQGKPLSLIQKQFLSVAARPSYMTAWKIVPMRRNFIVAIMGVVFTYSVLLESLKSSIK